MCVGCGKLRSQDGCPADPQDLARYIILLVHLIYDGLITTTYHRVLSTILVLVVVLLLVSGQ